MSPERDATAARECTADPIFLFQYRQWRLTDEPEGYHYDDDGDMVSDDIDEDGAPLKTLTWQDCKGLECAIGWWETERVFLTREEGERYGEQRSYNYPDGWQVYCVCASGRLADLLREHA